ncbi:MAG: PCMD domain-containing protein, partial [Flavobacteriales bacterium]|nr:PCMD domain-containing protein [Flavobacteriales bacterium]
MKKVTFTLLFSGATLALKAQQPALTNGNVETWTQFTGTNESYWEPGTGTNRTTHFLRTLNELADQAFPLTGPVTCYRESTPSDVHGGTYAAKMVSGVLGAFFLPGFLGTGDLNIPNQTIYLGRQFNGRPQQFRGWYKYTPVSGDSAEFRVWLTRYDGLNQQSVLVGEGSQKVFGTVSNYTQFSIDINYVDNGTPDTVVIFCTASAGYNLSNLLTSSGQAGSTLWADDLEFVYPASIGNNSLMNEKVQVYPSIAQDIINIHTTDLPESLKLRIYDMNGKEILTERMNGNHHVLQVSSLENGSYIILVQDNFKSVSYTHL